VRVTPLEPAEVSTRSVEALGLDPEATDVLAPEAMAAALRRAASFLCPATPAQLVDAVLDALAGMTDVDRDDVSDLLELLVSTGDLLELRQSGERLTRLIFLGPPTYITKVPGEYVLLGVRPDGQPLVDEETERIVQHDGHVRTLKLEPEMAEAYLSTAGLHELRLDRWLRHPKRESASQALVEYHSRLDAARPSGAIEGLEIIDPTKPVRYYRGRWRQVDAADTGDFVGRRPQAYGANAWCVVRIASGYSLRLIDLPVRDPRSLARDEAWRLQAAVDAERGRPQSYRHFQVPGNPATHVLDLFGPLPSWAERHLSVLGNPVDRSTGALFSYRLTSAAISLAEGLLTEMLWMRQLDEGGSA